MQIQKHLCCAHIIKIVKVSCLVSQIVCICFELMFEQNEKKNGFLLWNSLSHFSLVFELDARHITPPPITIHLHRMIIQHVSYSINLNCLLLFIICQLPLQKRRVIPLFKIFLSNELQLNKCIQVIRRDLWRFMNKLGRSDVLLSIIWFSARVPNSLLDILVYCSTNLNM